MDNDITWGKNEIQTDEKTIHRQLRNVLENSLAVIGLSQILDQKKSGTEHTLTNNMDPGSNGTRNDGKFFSIWSSDISCLQCL